MAYDLAVFSLAIGRMTKILYILSVSRNFNVKKNDNCCSNYLLSPEIIIYAKEFLSYFVTII